MASDADSRIIGRRRFTDGTERDVYEDPDGQQWVAGYDGEREYGVWLLPADEPQIVTSSSTPSPRPS